MPSFRWSPRSLRGRLAWLLVLLAAATLAAAALMYGLFQQSAAAQAGEAQAQLARACDGLVAAYRAAVAEAPPRDDAALRRALPGVVETALRLRPGVEGGVRKDGATSLAYAYPTYQGSGPKTDEPPAESASIGVVNAAALAENRAVARRFSSPTEILLIDACPLPGPGLTGWAMTRVQTFAGPKYRLLMTGLGVLTATLLGAVALLAQLSASWSRHVGGIEATLGAHDVADLPRLAPTGELELDRIVRALNDLGERLAAARGRGEALQAQLAAGERLAALGRVSAGVAHEIRNPIAAMRLRAETALTASPERQAAALAKIVEQIDRLDGLVSRLLRGTTETRPRRRRVALAGFLEDCARACEADARARAVTLAVAGPTGDAEFDPEQIRDALVNLIENAIEAAPRASTVDVRARQENEHLVFSVRNPGSGLPPQVRQNLFEPFVTTRPDAAGLGLAVVREIARAHQGVVRLAQDDATGVAFEIALPCRPS